MKYRVFITIEEENEELDSFEVIDDECLGIFETLSDAQALAQDMEDQFK